jgi:hypothetical protein
MRLAIIGISTVLVLHFVKYHLAPPLLFADWGEADDVLFMMTIDEDHDDYLTMMMHGPGGSLPPVFQHSYRTSWPS